MRMAFLRAARRSARHCECHRPSRSLCHSGAGTLRLRNRDAKPLPETEGQRGRHSANDLASLGSTPLAWRRTSDPARLPTHADRACANDRDFSVDPRTRRASPTIRQLQGRTDSRLRGYGSSPCSSHATRPRVAQAEPHRPPFRRHSGTLAQASALYPRPRLHEVTRPQPADAFVRTCRGALHTAPHYFVPTGGSDDH
jgi:hypothetical protein